MGAPFDKDNPIRPAPAPEGETGRSPLDHFSALLANGLSVRITEDHVQSLQTLRRGREALFGPKLFSDPAWDIILELYGASLGSRRSVCSRDLARSLKTPHSTIKRWIDVLVEAGHVTADPDHKSRFQLSQSAIAKMAQLVDGWGRAFICIPNQGRD